MIDETKLNKFKAKVITDLEMASGVYRWLDKSGDLLQCKPEALKKGRFYLIGFNPGGDPTFQSSLRETIEKMSITGDGKSDHPLRPDGTGKKGWKRGWSHLETLAKVLDIKNWENDLFITNIFPDIFPNESEWDKNHDGDIAATFNAIWPVHKIMLDIVQPDVIICHGVRAFNLMTQCLNFKKNQNKSAEFGRYVLRSTQPTAASSSVAWKPNVSILGLPHLSRYAPSNSKREKALCAVLQRT